MAQPKRAKLKVIGVKANPHLKDAPSRFLGSDSKERLTTSEWKQRFARNLDRLLGIVGLSRKEAADETGVDYRVIRRLVSDGISRIDDRGKSDLQSLAKFFCLKRDADLWLPDLLPKLLTKEYGAEFVRKFRPLLEATLSRRLAEASQPDYDEVAMLKVALGHIKAVEETAASDSRKIAVILSSDRAEQFRCLINDYFELVAPTHEARASMGSHCG